MLSVLLHFVCVSAGWQGARRLQPLVKVHSELQQTLVTGSSQPGECLLAAAKPYSTCSMTETARVLQCSESDLSEHNCVSKFIFKITSLCTDNVTPETQWRTDRKRKLC